MLNSEEKFEDRAIRITDLPQHYDKKDIIENLSKVGDIDGVILGEKEMIIIFATTEQKELSKMYDGLVIDDYVLNLEDTINLDVLNPKQESILSLTNLTPYKIDSQKSKLELDVEIVDDKDEEVRMDSHPKINFTSSMQLKRITIDVPRSPRSSEKDEISRTLNNAKLKYHSALPENDLLSLLTQDSVLLFITAFWGLKFFLGSFL